MSQLTVPFPEMFLDGITRHSAVRRYPILDTPTGQAAKKSIRLFANLGNAPKSVRAEP